MHAVHIYAYECIRNNLKVSHNIYNYVFSVVVSYYKCDIIVLTYEIKAWVIDFCVKILKLVTRLWKKITGN